LKILFTIGALFFTFLVFSQDNKQNKVKDSINLAKEYEISLKPTKAGFYSAILPGLGQGYNKKYWKIPFVYGALATSTYLYIYNDQKFNDYRDDYKKKKAGDENIELSLDVLKRAQEYHKKKRDGNMLLIIGVYVLQIVEASVDAHLQYHNIDDQLSFSPKLINSNNGKIQIVASLNFKF
jgi:hypothetical protein